MIERIDGVGTKEYDDAAALRQTVVDVPDAKKEEGLSTFWALPYKRGPLLPAWATRSREWALRDFFHHEYNWMGQSAMAGLTKKWAATPWEISGKNRVPYFQDLLRNADVTGANGSWDTFVEKVGLDFLRQDGGAYIEIIGPGNPLRPLTGKATGLGVLDSLRCYPTGDPEYPVVYYRRKGVKHLMHRSRVVQIVDQPDAAENNPGYGTCALSRAISIVAQQINMNRYVQMNLDDKPRPGYAVLTGMTVEQRRAAENLHRMSQSTDDPEAGSDTVWLHSINPEVPIKLEVFSWAQPPANWSYKEYTELHTNAWALALGIDVQELWQLTGGNIGSAGQSATLHAKSQGKAYGAFLTRMERLINDILPLSLEFEFKVRDGQAETEQATIASLWAGFVTSASATLSKDEQRRLLASTVEQYRDVVTNDDGEMVTLEDNDPEPTTQTVDDTGQAPAPDAAADPAAPEVTVDSQKDIAATRSDFISDFTALVQDGLTGDVNRRRAGVVLRAQLNRLGRQAYKDGMAAGGVEDDLDTDDLNTLASWVTEQSSYVTGFLDEVYGDGLSDAQVSQRAEMWANKSLDGAYNLGMASADRNGMYQWSYDPGKESCATCIKLNGQVHRLKDYVSRDFMPHSSKLACKGYLCGCYLSKTKGAARGQWPVSVVA